MIDRRQRRRSLSSAGSIGKYNLIEAIRTHPMRSLYRSYDPFLDRWVAIKIIQLFDPAGAGTPEASNSFFSEARAIGHLQHHNIVSVYDAGIGDYEGYIVMEYVEGNSLLQLLDLNNILQLEDALDMAKQICNALEYAHDRNVIHCDIKPSNIMITTPGTVKMVDFGISVLNVRDYEYEPALAGSPSYLAPELINGAAPNVQSDLYSLGVLLYEMITGRRPFPGDNVHAVMYKVINEPPEDVDENIPSSVKSFLYKALSKNPVDRYQTSAEFREGIISIQDEIARSSHSPDFDTRQYHQLQIFDKCPAHVMQELASCTIFEDVQAGDLIISGELLDEYICLVHGKALLVAPDGHIIVPEGNWITEKNLHKYRGASSCKALTSSVLMRVSRSNLLESSEATQAYFFGFVLEHLFIQ